MTSEPVRRLFDLYPNHDLSDKAVMAHDLDAATRLLLTNLIEGSDLKGAMKKSVTVRKKLDRMGRKDDTEWKNHEQVGDLFPHLARAEKEAMQEMSVDQKKDMSDYMRKGFPFFVLLHFFEYLKGKLRLVSERRRKFDNHSESIRVECDNIAWGELKSMLYKNVDPDQFEFVVDDLRKQLGACVQETQEHVVQSAEASDQDDAEVVDPKERSAELKQSSG